MFCKVTDAFTSRVMFFTYEYIVHMYSQYGNVTVETITVGNKITIAAELSLSNIYNIQFHEKGTWYL